MYVRAEQKNSEKSAGRYVRTARKDLEDSKRANARTHLRADLNAAGRKWRDLALQIWSALHPDPYAKPMRPIADICCYVRALLRRIEAGTFLPPPRIAQVRRDQARAQRRKVSAAERTEVRRVAEVAAALARGEYVGHGPAAHRRNQR